MTSRTRRSKLFCEFIYCECGCQKTRPKYSKHYDNGWKVARFIDHHHGRGESNPSYKDGKHGNRYNRVTTSEKRKYEHRLIYEEYHKCCVLPWIVVHHKNNKSKDNSIENLQLMTIPEHHSHHNKKNPSRQCVKCGSTTTYTNPRTGRYKWYGSNDKGWNCNRCYLKQCRLNRLKFNKR